MSILSHDMPKIFRYLKTFFGFSAPPVESPGRSSPPTPETLSSRHPMTSPEIASPEKKWGNGSPWITIAKEKQDIHGIYMEYTRDIHGILTINQDIKTINHDICQRL
jgi:predicted small metal-binding protein